MSTITAAIINNSSTGVHTSRDLSSRCSTRINFRYCLKDVNTCGDTLIRSFEGFCKGTSSRISPFNYKRFNSLKRINLSYDYTLNDYHQPSDEYTDDWDMSGIEQTIDTIFNVSFNLSNSDDWPNWYEDNEFRSIRDKQRP